MKRGQGSRNAAKHFACLDGSCLLDCTIAAAQTVCLSFTDTIHGVAKDRAVEKSLKSLHQQIQKWKADNSVTSPVTVSAEKPQPHPFCLSSFPVYALLPPDVVSDSAYTICWTGVLSPWSAPPAPGCAGEALLGASANGAAANDHLASKSQEPPTTDLAADYSLAFTRCAHTFHPQPWQALRGPARTPQPLRL